ncbi:MAG: hypothetical protein HQL27_05525 [Candidatus Omnitrophica bacterium]|nr:hypothetical protein [Candidatus Omnitrophota bacterium]
MPYCVKGSVYFTRPVLVPEHKEGKEGFSGAMLPPLFREARKKRKPRL